MESAPFLLSRHLDPSPKGGVEGACFETTNACIKGDTKVVMD